MREGAGMIVRSDRSYHFARPPEEVWAALGSVDAYRRWWPWLRRFDAEALAPGARWECSVRPPVPYRLRFTVTLGEVEAPSRITASVSGDIFGDACVSLAAADGGCRVRLTSELQPSGQPLRGVTRLAPWLAQFGHDWVLDTGVRQFRRRAL